LNFKPLGEGPNPQKSTITACVCVIPAQQPEIRSVISSKIGFASQLTMFFEARRDSRQFEEVSGECSLSLIFNCYSQIHGTPDLEPVLIAEPARPSPRPSENTGIDPTITARSLWLETHPLPTTLDEMGSESATPLFAVGTDQRNANSNRPMGRRSQNSKTKPIIAAGPQ
jgi:hypothetical protein